MRENVRLSSENSNKYANPNLSKQNPYGGTNEETYTSVSDYVKPSVNSDTVENQETEIPFIEHEENLTVEGNDAVERADNFEKRYAQPEEFFAEPPVVDDSEVYRPFPEQETETKEKKSNYKKRN